MEEELDPVVMDIGSGTLKAGLAGDDTPKCSIPMIVGTAREPNLVAGVENKDYYLGHECK